MWVGSMIQNSGFATSNAMEVIYDEVYNNGIPNSLYIEYVVPGDPTNGFGVVLDTGGTKNYGNMQRAVRLWSEGKPFNTYQGSKNYTGKSYCVLDWADRKTIVNDPGAGTCDYVKLQSGVAITTTAGIDSESIDAYNPSLNFSNLQPGQPVCKSVGILPDLAPKPNANGTCFTYTIKSGDSCAAIIAPYYPLSTTNLTTYNSANLAWFGCDNLIVGNSMCLSSGTPPAPTVNPSAVCGPNAPGTWTTPPTCPNNGCCSIYGQCGDSADVCEPSVCYSNCGYGTLPTEFATSFKQVGYWLDDTGGSLDYNVNNINTTQYDIIHYSFATINSDLSLSVGAGFQDFLNLTNVKKVVAITGLPASDSATVSVEDGDDTTVSQMFSLAVSSSANIDTFATNIVNFIQQYKLDGVHLDWEYPASTTDGANYNLIFKTIKSKMSTLVSISLPASYYYLQYYPLKDFDKNMDYFILMNYDYFGQWDYSTGTGVGCHVDKNITIESIEMIVKSGINTKKLYGGVANYGRTFQLNSTSCNTYGCPFTGPNSGAIPGPLTDFAGFMSENELLAINKSTRTRWSDADSHCDIMTYEDGTNWAAWMKAAERTNLIEWYQQIGLGGSALWALNYDLPVS
ncbi:uncharacterized protein J8A68_003483 [[Candida] subhashii]|uniref:Chitinase n=1 Tax=[Candida] subhashii TaxID=561895 RepID=A0A8J5Q8Y1_9ASCO|nr:uncharacterized protein J8A68_003483 [[Candida] subhashii]KAG7663014.1 hypothetical protein J8A68_003483 [[Candida] subhashii]